MAWLWSKIHLRFQSREGGKEKLGYLKGSFAGYIEEMERRLRDGGVKITTGAPVERITTEGNRATGIVLAGGTRVEADAVVAAVPSLLFKKMAPDLTDELRPQARPRAVAGRASAWSLTMKQSLSPIYWMNIGDRTMPFLALVEHTNFIGPENYDGNHILYISNYLRRTTSTSA